MKKKHVIHLFLKKKSILKKTTKCLKVLLLAILFVIAQSFSNNVQAQSKKVSIKMRNVPIVAILNAIETQTNYLFVYSENVDVKSKTSINAKNIKVSSVLRTIFDKNIKYETNGNHIFLKNKNKDVLNIQESINVKGSVKDKNGDPIIGCTIISLEDAKIGTVTDIDGNFQMKVKIGTQLSVSYIGYITKIVRVKNSILNIVIQEDSKNLSEVVVVGYAVQKKVNLTGSVSSIGDKELKNIPSSNLENMMQGKLPGVNISSSTGMPGATNTSIRIRGVGTMNNADPMVLVDGLESSMSDINPNDVESISVLKDAAAASIYGTRAANGVILVTTKRGKAGKTHLSYNGYVGVQKDVDRLDFLPSWQYATLYNEGLANEGLNPAFTDEQISKYKDQSDPDLYPNTNWMDDLLQGDGKTHSHSLRISGGNENAQYALSFGYLSQNGLVKRTTYDRYNLRYNLDSKVTNWLKMGINSSFSYSKRKYPSNSSNIADKIEQKDLVKFFSQANRIPPTYVDHYSDGSYGHHTDGNMVMDVEQGGSQKYNTGHVSGTAYAETKLYKGLTLKGDASVDYTNKDSKLNIAEVTFHDGVTQGPNSVSDGFTREMTTKLEALLNYKIDLGEHHIKALAGVSREETTWKYSYGFSKNQPNKYLTDLDAGSTDGLQVGGNSYEESLGSYFGRINYDFRSKYLLEANLRSDGSSKFAEGNRWGTFPSFSAGWRLSEEDFMKTIDWLNNLKIRASWGQLGNHRIGNYQYMALLDLGINYTYAGDVSSGAAQTKANNPDISWETTTELDCGIDVGVFKNLVTMSFDYYNRYTDDILTTIPVTYIYGLSSPTSNAGAMRNKGIEVSLAHNNTIGAFTYGVNGYISYNKNEVEKFPNPSKGDYIKEEGLAWNSFYGYEVSGIYMNEEEVQNSATISPKTGVGDLKYVDQNNDDKINGEDRIVLGNSQPKISYGFSFNTFWKGFDLTASFQGVAKVDRLMPNTMWAFVKDGNIQRSLLDRTIVENGEVTSLGKYPKLHVHQDFDEITSSFTVLDASYLRLKNLQIGYTLPDKWVKPKGISTVHIYLSGTNLFTLTDFPSGYDPEQESGWNAMNYPQVSTYILGLDFKF